MNTLSGKPGKVGKYSCQRQLFKLNVLGNSRVQ